ncbi:hypothetical protein ACHAWC_002250 [Mediolabrus comicus]
MTYHRDGFAGPFDIISLNEAKEALEEVQNELSVEGANRFKLHLVLPRIDRIAHHPKLVAAVQDALGSSDIWLWSSDINMKKEQSTSFFAPHQDATYAGLSPSSQCVTAWVALSDPVGENEGCLLFYPGSHKLGQLPHCVDKNDNKSNMLALGQYIDASIMQTLKPPISIPLRAGQATLHSFESVHASGSNNSPYPRVGLALRYMTCNVQQTKQYSREMATWICGADDTIAQERAADIQTLKQLPYGLRQQHQLDYFDVEPRLPLHPTPADFDRGRRAQKEAMEREDLNYFASHQQIGATFEGHQA